MANKDWNNLQAGPGIYEEGDKKNLKFSYAFAHKDLNIIKPTLKYHSYSSTF